MVLQALAALPGDTPVTLEPSGMVVMGFSILIVTGLAIFCIIRLMGEKKPGSHHHVPHDIDTHDIKP